MPCFKWHSDSLYFSTRWRQSIWCFVVKKLSLIIILIIAQINHSWPSVRQEKKKLQAKRNIKSSVFVETLMLWSLFGKIFYCSSFIYYWQLISSIWIKIFSNADLVFLPPVDDLHPTCLLQVFFLGGGGFMKGGWGGWMSSISINHQLWAIDWWFTAAESPLTLKWKAALAAATSGRDTQLIGTSLSLAGEPLIALAVNIT